jgi:hypothetical protein
MTLKATTHKAAFVSALAILLFGASAFAQGPSKPGPEIKKLDYFSGTWTTDATIAQGPWGSGGKLTSTSTNEWQTGEFFLLCHRDSKLPAEIGGDTTSNVVMGYDPDQHSYTADEFNSQGMHIASKGTLTGDTWVWTGSRNFGGMEIEQRMTLKIVSPTKYTMKFETSIDGTNWMTFMEGTVTKK